MKHPISTVLLSLLFLAAHSTIVPFLSIRDITPDILIIWVVYLAIRDGQMTAMTAGFFLGLAADLMSGADGMLGLSALARTVAGFAAGYFHNPNKTRQTLGGTTFLAAVAVAGLLHHTLYFLIFLQGSGIDVWAIGFRYGLPATLYTVAVALLPMFAFARIHRS